MSSILPTPLAHLRLDRVNAGGVCPDEGENGYHAMVVGQPELVPDDTLAGALRFAGTVAEPEYLRLTDLQFAPDDDASAGIINICFWLRTRDKDSARVICSADAGSWWEVSLLPDGRIRWEIRLAAVDGEAFQETTKLDSASAINDGEWHHVAVSFAPRNVQMSVAIDGQTEVMSMRAATPISTSVTMNPDGTTTQGPTTGGRDTWPLGGTDQLRPVLIGARPLGVNTIDVHTQFQGELSGLRLYRVPLPGDLPMLLAADKQSGFRASHPLDLVMQDDNDASVIVITDDPRAQLLHLDLSNTSPWSIELKTPPQSTPGSDNFHFSLHFRPGVLSAASLGGSLGVEGSPEWVVSKPELLADNSAVVYCLYTGSVALGLEPANRHRVTLTGISADNTHGAHGTRVEVAFGSLLEQKQAKVASGKRVKHLSIVNHSGKRHIPLHIGVAGSNTILNNGSTSHRLLLHLSNTSRDETLVFNPSSSSIASTLQLSFDYQDDTESRDWALCTTAQAQGLVLNQIHPPVATVASSGPPRFHRVPGDGWPQRTGVNLKSPIAESLESRAWLLLRSKEDHENNITDNDRTVYAAHAVRAGSTYIEIIPYLSAPEGAVLIQPVPTTGTFDIAVSQGDQQRHWTLTSNSKLKLTPGQSLSFELQGIVSSLPTGVARGYLHYENLPGHWDGTLSFSISKGPLTERTEHVGVGTANPETPLHVNFPGNADTPAQLDGGGLLQLGESSAPNIVLDNHGILARDNGSPGTLNLRAQVGIGTDDPTAPLHIVNSHSQPKPAHLGGSGLLQLGDPAASNIVVDNNQILARNNGTVGVLNLQASGGGLSVHGNQPQSTRVTVTDDGMVGLGTIKPNACLEINKNWDTERSAALRLQHSNAAKSIEVSVQGVRPKLATKNTRGLQIDTEEKGLWVDMLHADRMTLTQGENVRGVTVKATQMGTLDGWNTYFVWADHSSARYKEAIEPLEDDFSKILSLQPIKYKPKDLGQGAEMHVGYLAEQLDENGLDCLVVYDAEGQPDGIDYDRICLYLNEIVKQQQQQIERLEQSIAEQRSSDASAQRLCGTAQLNNGTSRIRIPTDIFGLEASVEQNCGVTLTAVGKTPYLLSYEWVDNSNIEIYGTLDNGVFSWQLHPVEKHNEALVS